MYKALISDFFSTLFDAHRAISVALLEASMERNVVVPRLMPLRP
jgi:hypothetical protein